MSEISSELDSLAVPCAQPLPAGSETDFEQWLTELLPSIRMAIAQQGFARGQRLAAFQAFVQQRNQTNG